MDNKGVNKMNETNRIITGERESYNEMTSNRPAIEMLIESYFNATASPEDIRYLLQMARAVEKADGPEHSQIFQELSPEIINDLYTILSLENWGSAVLQKYENKTPPDLEKRLEDHIAKLSKLERKRSWARWTTTVSSAAAVVIIMTIGLFLISPKSESTHDVKGTPSLLATQKGNDLNTDNFQNSDDKNLGAETSPRQPVISVAAVGPDNKLIADKGKKKAARHIPSPVVKNFNHPSEAVEFVTQNHEEFVTQPATAASVIIPENLSTFEEIFPKIATAAVNPTQLVVLPFTTLSQSFDNIIETITAVSVALSGVNDSFNTASSELHKMTTAQLRAI